MFNIRLIRVRTCGVRLTGYLLFALVTVIYVAVLVHKLQGTSDEIDVPVKCYQGEEELQHFEQLAIRLRDSFETLKVTYFLCYSTLFGALKYSAPLPWQRNLDFCILNEQLSSQDEGFIYKSFKKNGLYSNYNSKNGFYKVSSSNRADVAFARVFPFELDEATGTYRRIGWKHRLIPPSNCASLHCFPSSLVSLPLPTLKFINDRFQVPHEQEELLKYQFPDTWWKDIEPRMCKHRSIDHND